MKRMKNFLSILLALIMIVCAIPMSTYAAEAEETSTSGTCGENVTWTFDEATGTLTISGEGEMNDFDYDNRPWEEYKYKITSVIINNGVTTIGTSAFENCENIINATIPNSVISIGDGAFCYCISLANIAIPNKVATIGSQAFQECINLNDVTIPNSVTEIGDFAFCYCTELTSVTIGDSVTTIGYGAFANCSNLTNIVIPDSVTTLGDRTFDSCTNLVSASIGSGISTIANYMFYGCTNLESVTLLYGVTTIGVGAFLLCNSLTDITIPNSTTTICNLAFEHCESLTSITIPSSVTNIADEPFYNCTSLEQIIVDCNNRYYSSDECGVLFNKDKTELIQYPIGNTRTSYTIPDSVQTIKTSFSQCKNLTNINIGNNVSVIEDSAFQNCSNLTTVTIPNSVTLIEDWAFRNCSNISKVFYYGTEEEWDNISIGSNNSSLTNATIYYINCYPSIQIPSTTTIRYNDGIVLHANLEGDVPDGCTLVWTESNSNFSTSQSANGDSMQIISKDKGYTTFTLKLVDAEGHTLAEDNIEMYSKAGLFDKIAGFFRGLFGLTKIHEN